MHTFNYGLVLTLREKQEKEERRTLHLLGWQLLGAQWARWDLQHTIEQL